MQDPTTRPDVTPTPGEPNRPRRGVHALFERHRWLPFVLPLAVFLLAGQLEPRPAVTTVQISPSETEPVANASGFGLRYPMAYCLRIALTAAALLVALPWYRPFTGKRTFPLAIGVGLVGGVLWIGLCTLDLESRLPLAGFASSGERAAFNPYDYFANRPVACAAFLAVRLMGLVVVVPIIEEFFLRGFFMRFLVDSRWWEVEIGQVTAVAVIAGTAYGVLAHPGEMFAAAAWFSLVTWLMVRTRSLWACVAAHAVTNLALGVYVLVSGDWQLW